MFESHVQKTYSIYASSFSVIGFCYNSKQTTDRHFMFSESIQLNGLKRKLKKKCFSVCQVTLVVLSKYESFQ
jgi:hypothetical protein